MFAFGSWQGTAGSQRLELSVANVGTTGYHCKELPVPRGWNSWFPTWTAGSQRLELSVANVGTTGYHCKELPVPRGWNSRFPTWEPQVTVTIARNFRFPEVGTLCCQRGNHRLPLQGTAGSQRMELLVPNLGTRGYHCKQLPVPKGWNSLLPTWEPQVTIARNCRFPEDGTLGSQPGNQRLPLQATAGSQRLELTLPNLGTTGYHCKELPVPRGWNSRFPTWEPQVTIASKCRFPEVGTLGSQPGNHGLPLQATVKMIWKHFRYNFMVLLNGPVQNAWFCLMDRYRNVCVWFMARNCRFPKVGTLCCQRGNHRLPLQGTAGSQRMELLVPNLGTRGYHCKQLPVPKGWNSLLPTWEPQVTIARNCRLRGWNSWFPTWEPEVTIASNCRFPDTLPNLGTTGYHCKELPVPRGWNSRFPTWEPQVTIARNCRFPEVGTLGSQPGNHGLPLQATVKMIWKHFRYNFMVLHNGPVQNAWFCLMDRCLNVCVWFMARNCRFPKVGTLCCQRGNHRLPLQGTAGSQRMELLVPNLNCRFPKVGTLCRQRGNHRLPLQGTAGSQRLELTLPNLGTTGYHCKDMPVPRGWNSWFPTWEPWVTIASNC